MGTSALPDWMSNLLPELFALRTRDQYPAHVLSIVRRMVGGDKADYTEVDQTSGEFRVIVDPAPSLLRDLAAARRAYMPDHPVLRHFLISQTPDARLISDFLTRDEFHRRGLYGEFFARLGVEDQLSVVISDPLAPIAAAISVDRSRPNFTETDRRRLDVLRPYLAAARTNSIQFSRALRQPPRSDQPTAASSLQHLTDRQYEVLDRVARGHTNNQIALDLEISLGTVRKHVEHILRQLNLSTRTAAAALYLTGDGIQDASPWTATVPALIRSPTGQH